VSREPVETAYELRATSTVRRALSESLLEAVAAAAYKFITGPLLLDPQPDREAAASSDGRQV
jgi:mRNA interferase RelE/StbE